jgi:anti-sigma B factor antagonist
MEVTNLALHIANHKVIGTAVVVLSGRIVLGEETSALRANVNALLASGTKQIILNVDRVEYIDSAGLGILVATSRAAKSHGASLALCNLGSHFEEVMQITKLLTVFDTYKTEADAVLGMAKVADFHSIGELLKPSEDRVYHNNEDCAPGREISAIDRRADSATYRLCGDCEMLNTQRN